MYSVPLRRALVTGTDLPYPEGVAAAEVLKVGAGVGGVEENKRGLRMIVWSSLVAAGYALLAALQVVSGAAAQILQRRVWRDSGFDQFFAGADRRRPLGRPCRRHRDVRRPLDQLGLSGAALHGAGGDTDRHVARRLHRRCLSFTRCASSVPGPSALRRSGPCCGLSDRSSPVFAAHLPPMPERKAGRGRSPAAHRARHSRSASSPSPSWYR